MSSWALKAGLAGVAIVAASAYAIAQMGPPHGGMHGPMGQGGQGPQPPMMHGPMQGQSGMHGHGGMAHGMMGAGPHSATMAEMGVIHELLANHDRIKRSVTNLPDGIRTVTESDDPRIAQLIKEHVAGMGQRVAAGRDPGLPIESPALRAIFRNKDKIETKSETTDKGVVVVQTSSDPQTVAVLQQHAAEVTDLVQGGMQAMRTAMMRNGGMMGGMMGRMHGGPMRDMPHGGAMPGMR